MSEKSEKSEIIAYLGKKLDDTWFTVVIMVYGLWWPVLGLVAVAALVAIALSLAGCEPQRGGMSADDCAELCKDGIKQVVASNLKDCNAAIDKVSASCGGRAAAQKPNSPVRILSYKVKAPKCACASPSDKKYKDPMCKHAYCEGGIRLTMKVRNGRVDHAGYMRVECFTYNMNYPSEYIRRLQHHFKPNKKEAHTTTSFFVDFDHSVMRNSNVKKGTPLGTECFVVTPAPPAVQATARMPARQQSNGDIPYPPR